MIPYIPTATSRDEDYITMHLIIKDLINVHDRFLNVTTPANREQIVSALLAAGFTRPKPRKVSKLQLWTYGIETVLLALAAFYTSPQELPFIFGALWTLTFGSLTTFLGGLVINHRIDKESAA